MAYAFVQQVEASSANVALTAIASPAFGATLTAGNMLWYVVSYVSSGGVETVTLADLAGNTFTQINSFWNTTEDCFYAWGYAKNINSFAANVVTATYSSAVAYRAIYVAEYSGLSTTAPFDQTIGVNRVTSPSSGADGVTSTNLTPTAQPSALIGFSGNVESGVPPTAGTGFTSRTEVWVFDTALSCRPEDKRLTSTSAVAATFARAGANLTHYTIACNFIEASAATTPPIK